jgi:ABC-type taurine transport system substrate-binding protein
MTMVRSLLSVLVLSLAPQIAQAAEPINLTVGYQPYDTISYSAVVIRGLELWKKHLPAGSTVDFQAALQGAIIVNAMLADKQQIGPRRHAGSGVDHQDKAGIRQACRQHWLVGRAAL